MKNYLKYLTLSEDDERLGLYILHAGHNLIRPDEPYPYSEHPFSYKFSWENGRIINEFQINYIINGQGHFESYSGKKKKIYPGSIVLLFPDEWHRYRPDTKTGWDEYWIGFKGTFARHLMKNGLIKKNRPVLNIGFNDSLFELYLNLIHAVKDERPSYQTIAAGIVLQIIGRTNMLFKEKHFEGKDIQKIIHKGKLLLLESFENPVSPNQVSDDLNVSYSWFRKKFKDYTGLAPGKYQMQHRMIYAKELLSRPDLTIKEIAYRLGFESNFHFAKIFKSKTGITPGKFRKMGMGIQLKKENKKNEN